MDALQLGVKHALKMHRIGKNAQIWPKIQVVLIANRVKDGTLAQQGFRHDSNHHFNKNLIPV